METISHTCDLGFAAALLTLGHGLEDDLTDGDDGKKLFGFRITESKMSRLLKQFRSNDMQIDAQKYALSIKHVKKMLYS